MLIYLNDTFINTYYLFTKYDNIFIIYQIYIQITNNINYYININIQTKNYVYNKMILIVRFLLFHIILWLT